MFALFYTVKLQSFLFMNEQKILSANEQCKPLNSVHSTNVPLKCELTLILASNAHSLTMYFRMYKKDVQFRFNTLKNDRHNILYAVISKTHELAKEKWAEYILWFQLARHGNKLFPFRTIKKRAFVHKSWRLHADCAFVRSFICFLFLSVLPLTELCARGEKRSEISDA